MSEMSYIGQVTNVILGGGGSGTGREGTQDRHTFEDDSA
jgi:hypothetical protein